MHFSKALLFRPPFEDSPGDLLEKVLRGKNISPQKIDQDFDLPPFFLNDLISKLHNVALNAHSFSLTEREFLKKLCDYLGLGYHAFETMIDQVFEDPVTKDILPNLYFEAFSTSNDMMKVNSYLIWEEDHTIAIDTGFSAKELLKKLDEKQLLLKDLLLTHTHADHCQALPEIMEQTGATVWVPEIEARKLNQFTSLIPDFEKRIQLVTKENSWLLPSHQIQAVSTPGHTLGGISYLVTSQQKSGEPETPGVIFVGDALFARSIGKINPKNYGAGIEAIKEEILKLPLKTLIVPGHGPMTNVEYERTLNPLFSNTQTSIDR
jgi:hydroxyacylglutathione hydrolase